MIQAASTLLGFLLEALQLHPREEGAPAQAEPTRVSVLEALERDDVSKWPNLTGKLLEKGYTPAEIRKIYGANLLRVMRAVEKTAAMTVMKPARSRNHTVLWVR